MRPGMGSSSFYDPISVGSSRRSSQLSTATTGGVGVPPPPPSQLLAGQLQRLQTATSANNSSNLVLQVSAFFIHKTSIFILLYSFSVSDAKYIPPTNCTSTNMVNQQTS